MCSSDLIPMIYLSGQLVIGGGAALPPQPVLIAVGAAAAEFQASAAGTVAAALLPKGCEPHEFETGAGVANAVGLIVGVAEDKLGVGTPLVGKVGAPAAPLSFSCVRPYALTPSTAPMAT